MTLVHLATDPFVMIVWARIEKWKGYSAVIVWSKTQVRIDLKTL